ncbi:YT521-B-like domain-containing protein [Fimicolochytrium jonesii]|uniref:YT521-B-like domain-containing protein n=1 Tax=Fimicolochytrium jonesii TaxID=1396493 RepID=UPI0022FE5165|nr:YT521-B-like domain-containing protein [Fimicolochytrium jonesii]KAI8818944.1 YT521-B-like domain-containing protein [Fimicolochytrium jonesii]
MAHPYQFQQVALQGVLPPPMQLIPTLLHPFFVGEPSQQCTYPSLYPYEAGLESRLEPLSPRNSCTGDAWAGAAKTSEPAKEALENFYFSRVGNLPASASEADIRAYFSKCAHVSLRHLPASRSAYINFQTTAEADAAVKEFDRAPFNGCLLNCRRKRARSISETSSSSSSSSSLARSLSVMLRTPDLRRESDAAASVFNASKTAITVGCVQNSQRIEAVDQFNVKYFIMKSLNTDNLDRAKSLKVWSTQSKNEEKLKKAFETTKDVYLIFGANKTGEFYGYARLESWIPVQSEETVEWVPFVPIQSAADEINGKDPYMPPEWGKPFRIRWVLTQPLSFSLLKDVTNAWNGNKNIKISRDGTEIDPRAGSWVCEEFHREKERQNKKIAAENIETKDNERGVSVARIDASTVDADSKCDGCSDASEGLPPVATPLSKGSMPSKRSRSVPTTQAKQDSGSGLNDSPPCQDGSGLANAAQNRMGFGYGRKPKSIRIPWHPASEPASS